MKTTRALFLIFVALSCRPAQAEHEPASAEDLQARQYELFQSNENIERAAQVATGCKVRFGNDNPPQEWFELEDKLELNRRLLQREKTYETGLKKIKKLAEEGVFEDFPFYAFISVGAEMGLDPCTIDAQATMDQIRAHLKTCKAAAKLSPENEKAARQAELTAMEITAKTGVPVMGSPEAAALERLKQALAQVSLDRKAIQQINLWSAGSPSLKPRFHSQLGSVNLANTDTVEEMVALMNSVGPSPEEQLAELASLSGPAAIVELKKELTTKVTEARKLKEWIKVHATAVIYGEKIGVRDPFPTYAPPDHQEKYRAFLKTLETFPGEKIEKDRSGQVTFVPESKNAEYSRWNSALVGMDQSMDKMLAAINARPKAAEIERALNEQRQLQVKLSKHFGICVGVIIDTDPRNAIEALKKLEALSKTKTRFKFQDRLDQISILGAKGTPAPVRIDQLGGQRGHMYIHPEATNEELLSYLE